MMYFADGAELMVETDSPALNVYKYIELFVFLINYTHVQLIEY